MKDRKVITTTPELAAWYDNKYREMKGCWRSPDAHTHTARMLAYQPAGSLLDIGCGSGDLLAAAAKAGFSPLVGIDISKLACHFAKCVCPEAIIACCSLGEFDELIMSVEAGRQYDCGLNYLPFDWIASLGSLEHIINQSEALLAISRLADHFYFYVPNELWTHEDQPNELTMTDAEWQAHFEKHGLKVEGLLRLNDNTAFWGRT